MTTWYQAKQETRRERQKRREQKWEQGPEVLGFLEEDPMKFDVVADTVYENAVDNPKCYPKDTDAFMKALQDEGVLNKNHLQEYKPLMKVVAPV